MVKVDVREHSETVVRSSLLSLRISGFLLFPLFFVFLYFQLRSRFLFRFPHPWYFLVLRLFEKSRDDRITFDYHRYICKFGPAGSAGITRRLRPGEVLKHKSMLEKTTSILQ